MSCQAFDHHKMQVIPYIINERIVIYIDCLKDMLSILMLLYVFEKHLPRFSWKTLLTFFLYEETTQILWKTHKNVKMKGSFQFFWLLICVCVKSFLMKKIVMKPHISYSNLFKLYQSFYLSSVRLLSLHTWTKCIRHNT